MRYAVSPFLVPADEVAVLTGWKLVGDETIPLPRHVEAWDYQTKLRIQAGMSIDRDRVCADSGLDPSSDLRVLVVAKSTATKIERCVLDLRLPNSQQCDLVLDVVLSGESLGGRLIIETSIVARSPVAVKPAGAKVAGAILWSSRQDAALEGVGGLFPTDSEDFRVTRPNNRDAPWVLGVDQSDLESLFIASVRLTLNSGLASIAGMLSNPTFTESKRLAKTLELDVTRQLTLIAIQSAETLARPISPEGQALGDILRLLVSRIWPNTSVATLTRWHRDQPERIEVDIQQFVKAYR